MLTVRKSISNKELVDTAKEKLDPKIFDFIAGGAGAEWGLENNEKVFQQYQIVPRVLQGIRDADIACEFLSEQLSIPLLVSPVAFQKLAATEGEIATAKACEKAKTIFTLSTMSSYSIEDVATASRFSKWFQLYVFKNKSMTEDLIKRAEKAGYKALVITVDVPLMGMRQRDIKNQFSLPNTVQPVNLSPYKAASFAGQSDGSKIKDETDQQFDGEMSWETIAWIKSMTKLPIILKGILSAEDATIAVSNGVSAIIVSNHGGRQIDGVVSSLDALPLIANAVGDRIPLLLDGGIRTGEDVFKALALGASAVMFARPVMYALSIGGEAELLSLFNRISTELKTVMKLAGCKDLAMIRERGLSLLVGESVNYLREISDKSVNGGVRKEMFGMFNRVK